MWITAKRNVLGLAIGGLSAGVLMSVEDFHRVFNTPDVRAKGDMSTAEFRAMEDWAHVGIPMPQ
jgi:hypothetical protein